MSLEPRSYDPLQNVGAAKSGPIIVRPCVDAAEWNAFVSDHPCTTPQHAFVWGQVVASCFGFVRQAYRLFYSDGRVVAALPLIRFSAGWPFRAIYSLVFDSYGGPLIHPDHLDDSELLSTIRDEIDSEASLYGAFEARFSVPPTAPETVKHCLRLGRAVVDFKRSCPLLVLDRPLEQIVGGYRSSVLRAIKRSGRERVVVKENADIAEVRQAYPIYRATMDRLGGTAKPWRFIEALLREKLAIPFVARRNDHPIGLVILLVSSRMAIYWISASEFSASKFRPTNALINHAIRWCLRREIPVFSFGESAGERSGLIRFKEEWGTTPFESTVITRVYRPWIRRAWQALEPVARRTYAVWDRWRTSIP
jgi:Acetyltransferase (GNAT) domain